MQTTTCYPPTSASTPTARVETLTGFQASRVADFQRGRSGTVVSSGSGRLPRLLRLRAALTVMPS